MSTGVSGRGRQRAAAPTEVSQLGELADNLGLVLIAAAVLQLGVTVAAAGSAASVGIGPVDAVLSTVGMVGGLALAVGLPVAALVAAFWRAPHRTERGVKLLGRALVFLYVLEIVYVLGAMAFGVGVGLPALLTPPGGSGTTMALLYALPLAVALGLYYYTRSVASSPSPSA